MQRFWVATVADDLESLLHVLLHFAIRFLPHNCPDQSVAYLLSRYFDDFTAGVEGMNCGFMKYSAMCYGEIDITLITGAGKPATSKVETE